jgi:hypothetical protein
MRKGNHITRELTLQEIIDKGDSAQKAFQLDTDLEIIAKGALTDTAKLAAMAKKAIVDGLNESLRTAIIEQTDAEDDLIKVYNLGVDKANEVYPNNVTALSRLTVPLSKEATDVPLPEKIKGCSIVQGTHTGKGKMKFKSTAHVNSYMVMETQDPSNLLDEAKYYPANPVSFDNSRGGEVSPKDPTIPSWYRVYGKNATGNGEWSDPFGGFTFH